MENASKALLMAGAVLLGILLINTWTLLSSNFKGVSETHSTRFSTEEKQKYNSQILKNITSDNKITAQGIVTIVNLNKEKELGLTILVSFDPTYSDEDSIYNFQSNFLKEKSIDETGTKLKYYNISNIEYTDGLISEIKIKNGT